MRIWFLSEALNTQALNLFWNVRGLYRYLDNCKVVPAAPQALKDDLQQWLWKTSAELTKLPPKLDIVAH